ncbi:McrC family protein [Bradyrhizobium sp. HKCCYLRH1065]|uniref:McrC family protein n=1 Tax=unclassified Bradyrhizobium TaxID=2631580 RepID=UPI003EB98E4B
MARTLTVFEQGRLELPAGVTRVKIKERLLSITVGDRQAFSLRRGSVYATDLVGAVDLGDLKIEVLPKPFGVETVDDARKFMFNLLRWAGDDARPLWLSRGSSASETPLLEIVERRTAAELLQRLELGAPRRYHEVNERTSTLRGRIQMSNYSRQLPSDMHLLPLRHFPFLADNDLGRLLKALATTLRNRATSYAARRDLDRCLDLLIEVKACPLSPELVRRVRLSRLEAGWLGLVDLAGLIALGKSPIPTSLGATEQPTLLFPLSRLFESAVRESLADHLSNPLSCLKSAGEHQLLSLGSSTISTTALAVRPDLLITSNKRVIAAGDAKWKRLTESPPRFGVLPSDVFQLLTYMRLFQVHSGFLFFPRTEWMHSGWENKYLVSPTEQEWLTVVAINVPDLVSSDPGVRRAEGLKLASQVQVGLEKIAPKLESV